MFRKISLVAAIAATLAIPATELSARGGGHGGSGGHGGIGHVGAMHVGGGMHFGRVGLGARHFGVRSFHVAHRPWGWGHRRFFVRRHFRPYYVAGWYGGSCYRWRWTWRGLRRVWVCGPRWSYYY
jgi:hypothetical protein